MRCTVLSRQKITRKLLGNAMISPQRAMMVSVPETYDTACQETAWYVRLKEPGRDVEAFRLAASSTSVNKRRDHATGSQAPQPSGAMQRLREPPCIFWILSSDSSWAQPDG